MILCPCNQQPTNCCQFGLFFRMQVGNFFQCMKNFRNGPHGTKSAMLESKLSTGTARTKRLHQDKFAFSLFWMSQCVACSPAWWILYHVTASCKGPIDGDKLLVACEQPLSSGGGRGEETPHHSSPRNPESLLAG